jgi:hypothetical protein
LLQKMKTWVVFNFRKQQENLRYASRSYWWRFWRSIWSNSL